MKTILSVQGMSCGHCVRHVAEALEEIPGVSRAIVSLEEKTATVEHAATVTRAEMTAAVAEAGYEAL